MKLPAHEPDARTRQIVDVLEDAFADLMAADATAFRRKFRKMAADSFAFYRGSACLFYADMTQMKDPWVDERTSSVWIQGDLHPENFGTYMNSEGTFVFDVNDFDEAYVGHYTWDLMRFAAGLSLLCWSKAISDDDIQTLVGRYLRCYLDQVRAFAATDRDHLYSLRMDTSDGIVHNILRNTRLNTRVEMLERFTVVENFDRKFKDSTDNIRLDKAEYEKVRAAYNQYLDTIPVGKRSRSLTYEVKDIVGRKGFGIGSAGLPAFNVLVEGSTQALENDVVISMKQANIAAPSRIIDDAHIRDRFRHAGHRTAMSQRALQAHADPWLGYTELNGVGFVVAELSPYVEDLDWSDVTEPNEMGALVEYLGRATAKIHCVADEDADNSLVDFQTEDAILAVIDGQEENFVAEISEFAAGYARTVRADHALFVDAFRNGMIPGLE